MAATPNRPDERPADPEDERLARRHIAAVNTSAEVLTRARLVLQGEGYNVTTMNYGPRTYQALAGLQPALILLDVRGDERAGWQALERLQSEGVTRSIPLIVVSAEPEQLALATGRYRSDRCVAKPLDWDELLATIRALIGPP